MSSYIEDLIKNNDPKTTIKLNLSYNNIKKIEKLEEFTNLSVLNLSNNDLEKIENLKNLKELKEINFSNNEITEITGLENLKQLNSINLSWNNINSLENFPLFCKLINLNLDKNKFTKLKLNENFKDLIKLSMAMNLINEISFFQNFNKLEELNLYDNLIEKIDDRIFEGCSQLMFLDLSKNKLKSMSFLSPLKNLITLNISSNLIEKIDSNLKLEILENLDIHDNNIEECSNLNKNFPYLFTLDISQNCLLSAYELKFCEEMKNLYDINFLENPFVGQEIIDEIIEKYENLERINGILVRELCSNAKLLINEIKKELNENNYQIEKELISENKEELYSNNYNNDIEQFIINTEQIQYEANEIRKKYNILLGKNQIDKMTKKMNQELNKSYDNIKINDKNENKDDENKEFRKSETKFIIRKSKSKIGYKTNEFPNQFKPAIINDKISHIPIIKNNISISKNIGKVLPELKDLQNNQIISKKKIKNSFKDLFKPIETLVNEKKKNNWKDLLIKEQNTKTFQNQIKLNIILKDSSKKKNK